MLWLDSNSIAIILVCSKATAYKIIKEIKEEMEENGYFVNPNAKVPVKYFCERYGLDCDETIKLLTKEKTAHTNNRTSC